MEVQQYSTWTECHICMCVIKICGKATFNFYVELQHIRRVDYQYLDTSDNQKGLAQLRWRGPVDVNDTSVLLG